MTSKEIPDIPLVDIEDLVDIRTVNIDMDLPKDQRIQSFIKQIKNPYLFRCGDMVIQSVFSDTEITLDERLKQFFRIESS
ncbi:DUF6870 family protein [Lacrimispora sp.]|uniref:DUF6870 family protein n=1 Tax=Lacrimispora sp. TaxID=2719234 RepID=UPI0028AE77E3|nr:hypothetical protein [Lacrimispora sp.]